MNQLHHTSKRLRSALVAAVLSAGLVALPACGASASSTTTAQTAAASTVAATTVAETNSAAATTSTASVVQSAAAGILDTSSLFSERDLTQTADTSAAKQLTVTDGQTLTISEEGVYVVSGTASNCTIRVEAADTAKVQIVLNGVSITNDSAPAIYVVSADKVFVTTAQGSDNSLSVTGTFAADGDTNTNAVIYSRDDLTLNGLGSLTIASSDKGISCKDELVITGGSYSITSTGQAIDANDSIAISDGSFSITAGTDGLHAENSDDPTLGFVYIAGGTFEINGGSDGIQGTTVVQIDGGSFTISGQEGIEATYVQINGGTIAISASDDGINGTTKSTAYSPTIEITDGTITVDMAQGDTDGLDVNGMLYIKGGTISVNGQSAFDFDQGVEFTGGTVYVNGEQVTSITNSMMGGGRGGMGGGMGGRGGMAPEGGMDPGAMMGEQGMPAADMTAMQA